MKTSNPTLDRVLVDLGVPRIEERLSRDFFYRLGLKFPQQYGIACRDVTDCVRRAEALGAGPFLHTHVPAPNWMEHGQRRRGCRLEVALGYAGDVQIELLGPGRGTEHYSRALEDTDIAFHHVGIYQRGMGRLAVAIEGAGYPEVVRGGVSLGRALCIDFRYFDARQDHGLYLEVLDFSAFGMELRVEPFIRAYGRWMAGGGGRHASGR
ncbi:MAG: hypothetical protein AMJ62_15870 [Myxococcales bacterium SG8_38]|nr:MAG: hypothetical protein AMJ62_15870 [Myxococcales bacterium SG8_38]